MKIPARNLKHDHLDQPVTVRKDGIEYSGLLTQITHSRHHPLHVHILIESSDRAVIRGSIHVELDREITLTGEAK